MQVLQSSILQDEKIHSSHPDLINFPSTAEVYHAVFENLFYPSYIENAQGKILEANASLCKIFGYTENEMTLLESKIIFDTAAVNYEEYPYERSSLEKIKVKATGIRKNGVRFPCEVSSVIFTDDNGETRTINTIRDISKNYTGRY